MFVNSILESERFNGNHERQRLFVENQEPKSQPHTGTVRQHCG